ncbi:MAG: hypothetical protein ACRD16_10025, partial [Thermoanaerobaculia bacterium]
ADDLRAWICFGAIALVGSPALDLVEQAARGDRRQGFLAALAGLAVLVWICLRRGGRPSSAGTETL